MKKLISILVFLILSCSSESTPTSDSNPPASTEVYLQGDTDPKDTLHIINQTLGIGFSVSDLIVVDKTDSSALFDKLEDILFEFESSYPTQRAIQLANYYKSQNPDLITLQELTQMRQNGVLTSDFPHEILNLLNADSVIYELFFQPLNRLDLQVFKKQSDSLSNGLILDNDTLLDVDFNEGNAIYVKTSLKAEIISDTLFVNKVSFPFLEGDFVSERGFQHLSLTKGNRNFEIWNTHLEISDNGLASYSKNQATELLLHTRANLDTAITQIVSGNFNFKQGLGAHQILTSYPDFIELSDYAAKDLSLNTCCLDLLKGDDYTSRQVDYIFARHFFEVSLFKNQLNAAYFLPGIEASFLPATHSVIEAYIVVN